jgi:hypothetical protein
MKEIDIIFFRIKTSSRSSVSRGLLRLHLLGFRSKVLLHKMSMEVPFLQDYKTK